jgi:hypothetical protein
MSQIDSWHRKISTGRHFQNGCHNTAQIQHCSISTSWHWKISTGRHFQNGRHNTAKIQHCSISKVAFNLFFKLVVCGRFGRLHNRWIIIISCYCLIRFDPLKNMAAIGYSCFWLVNFYKNLLWNRLAKWTEIW